MKVAPSTRALVTGGSGCLGWILSAILARQCQVVATYASHPSVPEGVKSVRVDLCEGWSMKEVLGCHKPDVIVHLAAITDPDRCEQNPQLAFRVNYEATAELARLSKGIGSKLVFVSTDLVFDGSKGNYAEDDIPRPLSIYGMSKLRAEEAVLDVCSDALVLRSSLMYGFGSGVSKTFLARILEKLSQGEKMQLFTDQKRNPILVDDLAQAVVCAIEDDLCGLYHIGGTEILSRYEFGQRVCRVFGYDETLLDAIRMQDFTYLAKRPLDSSLNVEKFMNATGFVPSLVSEGLSKLKVGS